MEEIKLSERFIKAKKFIDWYDRVDAMDLEDVRILIEIVKLETEIEVSFSGALKTQLENEYKSLAKKLNIL